MEQEDRNDDIGLQKSLQIANDIKGILQSGKSVSQAAKGASVAGPYGAAIMLAWEHRDTIKKAVPVIMVLLLLPIMFILMLPSIIFNGLSPSDSTILNDNAAITSNIDEAKSIIQNTLSANHQSIIDEINEMTASLPENDEVIIVPAFEENQYLDALLIISQYCVYKEAYTEISLGDLRATLAKANGHLYSYTVSKEKAEKFVNNNEDNKETIEIIKHTYTIQYVGDDYFATNIFYLNETMRQTANNYAQNLMLFLYGANFATGGHAKVSADVLAYESLIILYAENYGIPGYLEIIKAIMMQESGGRLPDVMQASECLYNLNYPKEPNGITDPEYSIDAGIHYFADCLKIAGCGSPSDKSRLSLALQGYNFGTGYITWALDKYGGYSETNAILFSNEMKARLGWKNYGDPQYVAHVFRYYMFEGMGGAEGWGSPFSGKDWRKAVTSEFGSRKDPITGVESAFHDGIDIVYAQGTPISAVKDGIVIAAINSNTGFGNHIVIDHGDGTTALYGHCYKLHVVNGQQVSTGQFIAEVGTSGRSTGNHLHLTIKVNGTAVNPRLYIR